LYGKGENRPVAQLFEELLIETEQPRKRNLVNSVSLVEFLSPFLPEGGFFQVKRPYIDVENQYAGKIKKF
jgi:hypothetical protein